MTLGIWLVPVLLGFALLRFTHFFKRSFSTTTGYELFFKASLAGATLLVSAHFAVLIAEWTLGAEAWKWLEVIWKKVAPFEHSGRLAVAALLAFLFVFAVNSAVTDQDAAARWAKRMEGGAETLLRESLEQRKLVEVSTKSGRSYIGFVVLMGAREANWTRDVLLLPVASGYRDTETRRLRLTTNYTAPAGELRKNNEVAVMMSEVTVIRRFDLDVHLQVTADDQTVETQFTSGAE